MQTLIINANDPKLDNYIRLSENQLANINAPHPGYFVAESPTVIERALNAGYEPVSLLTSESNLTGDTDTAKNVHYIIEEKISKMYPDTELILVNDDVAGQIRGFDMTRGIMCLMRRKEDACLEDICKGVSRIAVIEDVMNPTNIGAIIRSAAALGMEGLLLTRGCADPLYRRAARVSMGTVFQIPWTYIDDSPEMKAGRHDYFNRLKTMGFTTASMALLEDSLSLTDKKLKQADKLAVILGSESKGLCLDTIKATDYTVCIPMFNSVDSLNVAAASAVAFWELSKKS